MELRNWEKIDKIPCPPAAYILVTGNIPWAKHGSELYSMLGVLPICY